MNEFEPVIIGFVCNECVYAAADLAGTSRMSYPSNVRLIRVPCSGQVDFVHILRAFENGADGVFVGGCLKEQCHYVDGNIKAEKRVNFLKEILKALGMEKERLTIQFMSASMGNEFARFAKEFTLILNKLGPSPLKKHKAVVRGYGKKRAMLYDMLLNISSGMKKKGDYNELLPGFGEIIIDEKKCFGCGACAYVCKDGAMITEIIKDKININNTYWKCTACRTCKDVCPKECLDVEEGFDLMRFLDSKEELKAEVGMMACERCGKSFLPILLASEVEKMLTNNALTSSYVDLCPTCRKFIQAEKIRIAQGFISRGEREAGLRRVKGRAK
jgi:coenzyme F420-reducing hydrogenase delta subunit/Pyruvate/2-oxoacid:ferredoxin oxidoreductase delta subunit